MKHLSKKIFLLPLCAVTVLASCARSDIIQSLKEDELFTLPYGSFEKQLSVADFNRVGTLRYGIAMRDGFFYAVDGDSRKIMEFNSYGDLLSLFYSDDSDTRRLLEENGPLSDNVYHPISFPFNYLGIITVDSNKTVYTACELPVNRQEQNEDGNLLYSQVVLRFARDGSNVDYLGQQGPGGTPFPFIKNLYTTEKDELVVVCSTNDGFLVFWFAPDGFLKYKIPVSAKAAPVIELPEGTAECYLTIENIIPDAVSERLFIKIDYFTTFMDEETRVMSGVNYNQSLLYPLEISTGLYGEPVSIPPYEESVVADYSRLIYKIPYDFLGVTKSGWKYFIIKTETGFNLAMLQSESQKILHRHFDVNHNDTPFYRMSVSAEGIITVLYIEKNAARVVWYRTDNLIDAIVKN